MADERSDTPQGGDNRGGDELGRDQAAARLDELRNTVVMLWSDDWSPEQKKAYIKDRVAELQAEAAHEPRNLTDHQKAVEEAAGMGIDWGMANAATVAGHRPDAPVQAGALLARQFKLIGQALNNKHYAAAGDLAHSGALMAERTASPPAGAHKHLLERMDGALRNAVGMLEAYQKLIPDARNELEIRLAKEIIDSEELSIALSAGPAASDGAGTLPDLLDKILPGVDEYFYVEHRGSGLNYRGGEIRFVIDRRGKPVEGKPSYENADVHEWIKALVAAARAALPSGEGR